MGLYYVENLYYCVRECCHCSITGRPPVEAYAAIKGEREVLPKALAF